MMPHRPAAAFAPRPGSAPPRRPIVTALAIAGLVIGLFGVTPTARADNTDLPNAEPRQYILGDPVHDWDFDDADGGGAGGWEPLNDCELEVVDGRLKIRSLGGDPYLSVPVKAAAGSLAIRLRVRSDADGKGQFFWSTIRNPGHDESRQVRFDLIHDGQWHDYLVPLESAADLTSLRFDPAMAVGTIEVDRITLHRGRFHPLEIARIDSADGRRVLIHNHDDQPITTNVNGQAHRLPAAMTTAVELAADAASRVPLESLEIVVESAGLPTLQRSFWQFDPSVAVDAFTHRVGDVEVEIARDGAIVRLHRDGQVVAALAPLVHRDGRAIGLSPESEADWPLKLTGPGVRVTLGGTSPERLEIAIDADDDVEGPVVRVLGDLEQGLLAGVEYLGRGEMSSSRLDIETDEHLRVEPPPRHLTMPLMALVTDRISVAMNWDDTALQPTFASPDWVDHTAGHRMSLKGRRITSTLRIDDGWAAGGRLEDAIEWAVRRRGLPPLPEPPRSAAAQTELSLAAYRGAILDAENGGWFHAVVPGVRTMPARGAPLADCASAIFRLTGEMPDLPRLQYGGAHVNNSTSYFVSGRADQWLDIVNRQAANLRQSQLPDGSYRYDGEYRRGHFEDTASGVCGRPAFLLLEHAHLTGNADSLSAGLKTLRFAERFRTPRGAQTWEVPLHTPDILASAHLVWAHTRAFELTGDQQHLDLARRWAISGLPFVYQWSDRPIMSYATTAVYGATNWEAPNWIGLPVQWCGTVYAYALLLLAPHEPTFNWRQVAEGILICGEQMQYPNGPSLGTLPDAFALGSQNRIPADINPGVLVDLRRRISGQQDALAVAHAGPHRVVSPFPVEIVDGRAEIRAPVGQRYQIVIDGSRIVDITSQGHDLISLAP